MRLLSYKTISTAVIGKFILLALLLAVLGSVFISHLAMAGGPIIVGHTYVMGKDRRDGRVYGDPSTPFVRPEDPDGVSPGTNPSSGDLDEFFETMSRLFPQSRTILSYKGDNVNFKANVSNWDPFPLPGPSWVSIYSYNSYTNEKKKIDDLVRFPDASPAWGGMYQNMYMDLSSDWYPRGSGQSYPMPIEGPGSNIPGTNFCMFIKTNPTVYLGPIVIVGNHDYFDTHGPLGYYGDWLFVPIGRVMGCAEVAYNYNLVPSLKLANPYSVHAGEPTDVSVGVGQASSVDMSKATYSRKTQWQITEVVIPPGATKPHANGGDSTLAPCPGSSQKYFSNNTGATCSVVKKGNGKDTIFEKDGRFRSGTEFPSNVRTSEDIPAGSTICYALSINTYKPYPENSNEWRHSALSCSLSGKRPKVQIHGGDLYVGGKIVTSVSNGEDSKQFGSWAEYASYSVGTSTGFATASGLQGGVSPGSSVNALTFANAQGKFGEFKSSIAPTNSVDIGAYFTQNAKSSGTPSGTIDLSELPGRKAPYLVENGNTPRKIDGGNIGKGKTVVIVATGDVIIQSDIHYTSGSMTTVDDIPQVVIVARNIYIAEGVENVDAWLIADKNTGTIDTCRPRRNQSQNLTTDVCKDQLRVNGHVVTSKLLLNRTAGSEFNDQGKPAEIFNLGADAFLWALHYTQSPLNIYTSYQIEQPPRF